MSNIYEYELDESQFDQLCRENLIGIDEQTTEDYILKFEELCFVNGINSSVSHPEVGSVTTQEFSLKGLETNTEKLRSSASGRQNLVENDKVALRMKTLLSLKFLNETKFSCNYTNCLVDFLNSPSLVEVVQEPEDVVLYFKSRQSLLLRLSRHCGINSEAQLRKLEQRAAFKLLPNEDEYEILAYARQSLDGTYPVREVKSLLRDYTVRVKSNNRFIVRVDLVQMIKIISNKALNEKTAVRISSDNIIFRGSHNGLDYFNGDLCVREKEFLRMMSGSEEVAADMAALLSHSGVKEVLQDWNQELVFTFPTPGDYNKFISQATRGNKQTGDEGSLAIVPQDNQYALVTQFKIDIRDFFVIDNDCRLSKDSRQICCKNKLFPFLCFIDENIMKKYSVKLSDKCIINKEVKI